MKKIVLVLVGMAMFMPSVFAATDYVKTTGNDSAAGISWDITKPPLRVGAAPSAPTGVSAGDSNYFDKIRVSWSQEFNADWYEVWRNTSSDNASAAQVGVVSAPLFDDAAAETNCIYYYWVKAANPYGSSPFSAYDTGWRAIFAPPTNVTATYETYYDKIRITWSAVAGASRYQVWRSTSSDNTSSDNGSAVQVGLVTAPLFDDTGASQGTTYYYRIKATNAQYLSVFSDRSAGRRAPQLPPAAPCVEASDGNYADKIRVHWNSIANAIGYQVWRNTSSDNLSATQVGLVTSPLFDDTSTVAGGSYYYWVKAGNEFGDSGFGAYDTGWRAVLAPPTNVLATDGTYSDKVRVTWAAAANASRYQVWRSTSSDNTSSDNNSAENIGLVTAPLFDDSTAGQETQYYYRVKSVNSQYTSVYSECNSGWRSLIASPTNVHAADGVYTDKVTITWSSVANATGYQVWRNTSSDNGSALRLGVSTAPLFDDSSASPGAVYYYWVRALNATRISVFSDGDSGYRALSPPTDVSASDGTFTEKIQVMWNAVSGATGYEVWRHTNDNSAGASRLAAPLTMPYDDTGAEGGIVYYYWVKAKNVIAESGFSASDTGWRVLSPPTGVRASDGVYSNKVRVSWTETSSATGYEVWRYTNNSSGAASKIASPGSPGINYDDTNVVFGTLYYYWVKAVNALGASGFSSPNSGYAGDKHPVNDYDGDGISDLAVYGGGVWYIYSLTNGSILLDGKWGGAGWIPVPGDYDGDGKADLAVYGGGAWYIYSLTNGSILLNGKWGGAGWTTVPGDYDGDGISDLAVYGNGYWNIYSLTNGSILLNGKWGGAGWTPVPGDYDGDGESDLAVYGNGYWNIYSLANGGVLLNGKWGAPGWIPVR